MKPNDPPSSGVELKGKMTESDALADELERLAQWQFNAVQRIDLVQALTLTAQMNRLLPRLSELLQQQAGAEDTGFDADRLKGVITRAHKLNRQTRELMVKARDNMARLLQEIRSGRQMLARYRPVRPPRKVFEIMG